MHFSKPPKHFGPIEEPMLHAQCSLAEILFSFFFFLFGELKMLKTLQDQETEKNYQTLNTKLILRARVQ